MQYRLRTLLIAFSMIAMLLGPLAERYRKRRYALDVLKRADCSVVLHDRNELPVELPWFMPAELFQSAKQISCKDKELTGEALTAVLKLSDVIDITIAHTDVRPETVSALAQLPRLRKVCFFECRIREGAIAALQSSQTLEEINLAFSNVTCADCKSLAEIKTLRTIWLYGSTVTDEGVFVLAKLPALSRMDVSSDGITQKGIENLLAASRLKHLTSYGDNFPEDWWGELKAKHPNCRIHR